MTRRMLLAGLACVSALRDARALSLEYLCFFDAGQAVVSSRCRAVVTEAAEAWRRSLRGQERSYLAPNGPPLPAHAQTIEVRGYAPDAPDPAARARLSLARARVVADALNAAGVPRSFLKAVGLADRDMLVPDSPEDPQNHRAQIVFQN